MFADTPLVPRAPSVWSPAEKACCRGFTLIELLIVIAMIFTLVAIGYPIYGTALEKAKVARAIADIRVLSTEIGTYQLFDGGLPLSLADIGRATFKDPYGNPYEYLNFAAPKGQCQSNKDDEDDDDDDDEDKNQGQCQGQGGNSGIGQARKDRFLVPLNSDYDLYSKGQDGESVAPLTAAKSRDDIIRANDGGFIGLASEY